MSGNLGGGGGDLPGRLARAGYSGTGGKGGSATTRRYQRYGPQDSADLDRAIIFVGAATAPSASSAFEIRIPDVKCHLRVVLALSQASGAAIDPAQAVHTGVTGANTATLWVASRSQLKAEFNANLLPPTRNIVGTGATPLTIPTDTRLWGYEFEIETAAETLRGLLAVTGGAAATAAYRWHLQAYYQSVEMVTDDEWIKMIQMMGITRADVARTGF